MKKREFVTSEAATVTYLPLVGGWVKVKINNFYFTRCGWDELTAVLFPQSSTYEVDLDVWLPMSGCACDTVQCPEHYRWANMDYDQPLLRQVLKVPADFVWDPNTLSWRRPQNG